MVNPNDQFSKVTAEPNLKDISLKAWAQKLLVALLCMASFYGGWKSHESNMVKQCYANGGQVVEGEKTLLCELS